MQWRGFLFGLPTCSVAAIITIYASTTVSGVVQILFVVATVLQYLGVDFCLSSILQQQSRFSALAIAAVTARLGAIVCSVVALAFVLQSGTNVPVSVIIAMSFLSAAGLLLLLALIGLIVSATSRHPQHAPHHEVLWATNPNHESGPKPLLAAIVGIAGVCCYGVAQGFNYGTQFRLTPIILVDLISLSFMTITFIFVPFVYVIIFPRKGIASNARLQLSISAGVLLGSSVFFAVVGGLTAAWNNGHPIVMAVGILYIMGALLTGFGLVLLLLIVHNLRQQDRHVVINAASNAHENAPLLHNAGMPEKTMGAPAYQTTPGIAYPPQMVSQQRFVDQIK